MLVVGILLLSALLLSGNTGIGTGIETENAEKARPYNEESLSLTLVEESPVGTLIASIGPPGPGYSPWQLKSASPLLTFHPSNGQLLTSGPVDRELLATDPGTDNCFLRGFLLSQSLEGATRLIRLNVQVLDLNDNGPRLANNDAQKLNISILESSPVGARFRLGIVRDWDAAENGTLAGAELQLGAEQQQLFRLDRGGENPVELTLELLAPLDRERRALYKGQLLLSDAGRPPRQSRIPLIIRVLDANDNQPRFEQSNYELRLPMESPTRIRAFDPDEGPNGLIDYRIVGPAGAWSIDERSGELRWNGSNAEKHCPGKETSNCRLEIEAQDRGQPPLSARVLVNIVKQPGSNSNSTLKLRIRNLPSGQTFAIFDPAAPNGTVLAILNVDGQQQNEEKLEFRLLGGDGKFRVENLDSSKVGLLRLNQTGGEAEEPWNVTVLARMGQLETQQSLQIYARPNDTAPIPVPAQQTVQIAENAAAGTLIAQVDYDAAGDKLSQPVNFRITSLEGGLDADLVEIHSVAGLLRLRRLMPKLPPGMAKRDFSIGIELSRPAPSLAKSMAQVHVQVLDVNNHAPVFVQCPTPPSLSQNLGCVFSFRVPENRSLDLPLLEPEVRDDDAGQNAQLRFSIEPFEEENSLSSLQQFHVHPDRGHLFLRRPLDFERRSEHRFWLTVRDGGVPEERSARALVEVLVEDLNDEAPHFPMAVDFLAIRLSQPLHSPLWQAKAEDADAEDKLWGLRYVLLDTPVVGPFRLEYASGWLSLAKPLDEFEQLGLGKEFRLLIGAVDRANRSSPNPLELRIRIVADTALVPAVVTGNQPKLLLPAVGTCLGEEQILEALALGEGQTPVSNISLLPAPSTSPADADANPIPIPPPLSLSSNGSLCVASDAQLELIESSMALFLDLGSDGWLMASLQKAAENSTILMKERRHQGKKQQQQTAMEPVDQRFPHLPTSASFFISNVDDRLRPGHLLANLLAPSLNGSSFHAFVDNNNSHSQFASDIVGLFADGQIRLLGHPPRGIFRWRRRVELILRGRWNGQEWEGSRTVQVAVYIQSSTAPPKCPQPRATFWWSTSLPPGAQIGKLKNENHCPLCRISLAGTSHGLQLEEGSGQLLVGPLPPPTPGSGTFPLLYRIASMADWPPREVECSAEVQIVQSTDAGTRMNKAMERMLIRRQLAHSEAVKWAAAGQPLLVEVLGQQQQINFQGNGTLLLMMRDTLGSGQHFQLRAGQLFVASLNNETVWRWRPLYLLEPANMQEDSQAWLEIRLQIVPPFAAEMQIQLFCSAGLRISVGRSTAVGTPLANIEAKFPDEFEDFLRTAPNFSLQFELKAAPNVRPLFRICPLTGRLLLAQPLAKLRENDFTIEVHAFEQWSLARGHLRLEIQITDAAEVEADLGNVQAHNQQTTMPGSAAQLMQFWLPENAALGETFGQIPLPAADKCGAEEENVQIFEIIQEEFLPFSVGQRDGILRVRGPLDAEQLPFFAFRVSQKCGNGSQPLLTDIHVFVLDANEHQPSLESMEMEGGQAIGIADAAVSVPEDAPVGHRLCRLQWTDADLTSSQLHVRVDPLLTEHGHLFSVDSDGWLRLAGQLDREGVAQHKVHLRIWDGQWHAGSTTPKKILSSAAVLSVLVSDVNDNPPTFGAATSVLELAVEENALLGAVLGTLPPAWDPDLAENGTIHYRIVPRSLPGAQVLVDPVFGYLTLNAPLDREQMPSLQFRVQAYDQGRPRRISEMEVRLRVLDQDDNAFELAQPTLLELNMWEHWPAGHVLTRLRCTDRDQGPNGLCLFRIEAGNADGFFRLAAGSGLLTVGRCLLEAGRRQTPFWLNISAAAFSGRWPQKQMRVKVSVLPVNRPPYFPPAQSLPILVELGQGTRRPHLLRQIKAVDLDQGANGSLAYSLVSSTSDSQLFAIDSETGNLSLIELPLLAGIDSEHHRLLILAADGGHPSLSASLQLVVRFVPSIWEKQQLLSIWPPIYSAHLAENAEPGTEIVRVRLENGGESGTTSNDIRFRLVDQRCEAGLLRQTGNGIGEQGTEAISAQFVVDPVEGTVRLVGPLNAKSCSLWLLSVAGFHLFDTQQQQHGNPGKILVWVEDLDEASPEIRQRVGGPDVFLPSNAQPGHPVLVFDVLDGDASFAGSSAVRLSGDDTSQFTLDQLGLLKLAKELPTAADKAEFSVQIGLGDRPNGSSLGLRLYTAEPAHFPRFQKWPRSIPLPAQPNPSRPLATFLAQMPGNWSQQKPPAVFYSIAAGDPEDSFRLDPFTGQLFFQRRVPHMPRQLHIAATSALGPYSSFVSVKLGDQNRHLLSLSAESPPLDCHLAPVAVEKSEPEEAAGQQQPFLSVEWSENEMPSPDHGLARIGVRNSAGPFQFEFVDASDLSATTNASSQQLRIDQSTGIVHVAQALDRETAARLRVGIRVRANSDAENGWREGICMLEIRVLDRNDNPPKFQQLLNLQLDEMTSPGSIVYHVKVSDEDGPENAKNTFALLDHGKSTREGDADAVFHMRPNGELLLLRKLDADKEPGFRLTIVAEDGEWQVQSAMHIHVLKTTESAEAKSNNLSMPTSTASTALDFHFWLPQNHCSAAAAAAQQELMIGKLENWQNCEIADEGIDWLWIEPAGDGENAAKVWADRELARLLDEHLEEADRQQPLLVVGLQCSSILSAQIGQNATQVRLHFHNNRSSETSVKVNNAITAPKERRRPPATKSAIPGSQRCSNHPSSSSRRVQQPKAKGIESSSKDDSPQFSRSAVWEFQVSRDSGPRTIVGQLQLLPGSHLPMDWQFLLDQRAQPWLLLNRQGELTLRRKVGAQFDDGLPLEFRVAIVRPGMEAKSCLIRLHFLEHLPASPVFSLAQYNIRLPSLPPNWHHPNGTEMAAVALLNFADLQLPMPEGHHLAVESVELIWGQPSLGQLLRRLFCFPVTAPTTLALCDPADQKESCWQQKMSQTIASLCLRLDVAIRDSSGQIRSRSLVRLEIGEEKRPMEGDDRRRPFRVGFVREGVPGGQNVLRLPAEDGPWQFEEAEDAQKLFRLNGSTGILSTAQPLSRRQLGPAIPVRVRSSIHRPSALLWIGIDPTMDGSNAGNMANSVAEYPLHIFVPHFGGAKRLPTQKLRLAIDQADCGPTATHFQLTNDGTAELLPNCLLSITLPNLESTEKIVPQFFRFGDRFEVELQSMAPLLPLNRWLVKLNAFGSTNAMAALLGSLANSVPDLSLLVPLSISDDIPTAPKEGAFAGDDFPQSQQLLVSFRDANGAPLPAAESMAILEHFAHKRPNEMLELWDFRVEKLAEECQESEKEMGNAVNNNSWLIKCLHRWGKLGAKQQRLALRTADKLWAPLWLPPGCLDNKGMEEEDHCSMPEEEEDSTDEAGKVADGEDKKPGSKCPAANGRECARRGLDLHRNRTILVMALMFLLLTALLLLLLAILRRRRQQQQQKKSVQQQHGGGCRRIRQIAVVAPNSCDSLPSPASSGIRPNSAASADDAGKTSANGSMQDSNSQNSSETRQHSSSRNNANSNRFSSSSAGFSSVASLPVDEVTIDRQPQSLLQPRLEDRNNSNFYQQIVLDWSGDNGQQIKNYVNWPPPVDLKEEEAGEEEL